MSSAAPEGEIADDRIMLGLLESVERNSGQSQRLLAAELGIALGLVNAYLKRCVKKGLVKVAEAPARRYAYYLTPQGFAEKSRLTVSYLSYSFSFFREARGDCAQIFSDIRKRGFGRVAIAGASDLAEIARICALESGIEIIAIVDGKLTAPTFVGVPVVKSFGDISSEFDVVVVADLSAAREVLEEAVALFGDARVMAPKLLGLRLTNEAGQ